MLDCGVEPETEVAASDEPVFEVLLLARIPSSVTASKLLAAFWYAVVPCTIWVTDVVFQLFAFITGYAAMNAATDSSDNSCSRMMRPGLLGPVSHWVMDALMICAVVPPEVRLQSSVLERMCQLFTLKEKGKLYSWFQMMVVNPKT